jgi:ParB/RepB/Spo0J family partition protein
MMTMKTNEAKTEETTQPVMIKLPISSIKPGINPRTEFDREKLTELAQSIKDDRGPLQPPVVYLDEDGLYGLIAGERRWRASKEAGLEEMTVIVRPKPMDYAARKMALKENIQREDLTLYEVALAVQEMLAEQNEQGLLIYSKSQLADELGKSPQFVANCEALLRCSERLKLKVHQKKVPFELAAMIGSLPPDMHEMAETDMIYRALGCMSVVEARRHIAEKYRRDLRKAQFKKEEEDLIPGVPACGRCEFNGGNRADIVGKHRDSVCLNPACFERKQRAYVQTHLDHSDEGDGVKMLGEEMRDKVFTFDGTTVRGDSGYVAADECPDKGMLSQPNAKTGTWGEIAEGRGLEEKKILDATGRLRTLYDARAALQAAVGPESKVKALFKGSTVTGGIRISAVSGKVDKEEAERKAAEEKAKASAIVASGQTWVQGITAKADDAPEAWHEISSLILERLTEQADREWMGKVLGVKNPMDYAEGRKVPEVLGLALVARALRLQGPVGVSGVAPGLCKLLGYDVKREEKLVEQRVKAEGKKTGGRGDKETGGEKLVSCGECGRRNFTERGLKAHVCKGGKESALLEERPSAWIDELMVFPIGPSEANEHGVFLEPLKVKLIISKSEHVGMNLAFDGQRWAASSFYEVKDASGGGLPSVQWTEATRVDAVGEELSRMIERHKKSPLKEKLEQAFEVFWHSYGEGKADLMAAAEEGKSDGKLDMQTVEAFAKELGLEPWDGEPEPKPKGGKREADPEAELRAWNAYRDTGSIKKAAEACGMDVESVKNWHKRRGWKAKREAIAPGE